MSDRIIQGFSEMKDIYLTQILTEEKEDEDYGEKFEKKYKKTGKKSKDYDGDGKVEDEADEYAGVKDRAIKDAMDEDEDEKPKKKRGKKKEKEDEDMQTESFSDWRSDLNEVISKLEPKVKDVGNEQITEKPVNNIIVLNPSVTEQIAVLDSQELSEEFIVESANIAADYFVSQGLNEHGLEMVIDYLGEEKFLEYVFYVTEDTLLTEERPAGKRRANSKSYEQVKAEIDAKEAAKKAAKAKTNIGKAIATDKGEQAVKAAVQQQPATKAKPKTIRDGIAARILSAIDKTQQAYQQGMERHRAATTSAAQTARTVGKLAAQTAQTAGKAAGVAGKAIKVGAEGATGGFRQATGLQTASGKETKLGRDVAAATLKGTRKASRAARDLVARQVGRTRAQANESVHYIMEKAVSEQQQKIFGLALSVKRGEVSRSKVSDRVLEIVDGMSEAEIRKFASTKHKGIPHKKEE